MTGAAALAARVPTERASEFGHDEIDRLIHLLKEGALKDLMRRNRLGDLRAVVVSALRDRGGRVLLRVCAEKQDRSVRDTVAVGHL